MLNIPMKLVLPLGEGRFQLECMCGHQFTFAMDGAINANEQKEAVCPACKSTWDGDPHEMIQDGTMMALQYYAVYVRFADGDERNELLGINKAGSDGMVRYAVGLGVDIRHYGMPALSKVCDDFEPSRILIKKITLAEFEDAKNQNRQRRVQAFAGMLKTMTDLLQEKTDGGSGDKDDRDRGEGGTD